MMKRAGGLLLALAWAVSLAASGWPQFKGDAARSGRGPALTPPLSIVWRAQLKGSLYSSPAIVDGRVYLGSSAKRLVCLSLKDGAVLWEHALPDRVWGSAPAVAQGRVYVGCVDGCVHALATADGSELARYCAAPAGFFGHADVLSSPLITPDRLLFGSDDHKVYAWDLSRGAAAFSVETGAPLHDNAACAWGSTAYIASQDGRLYALALADGAQRWAFEAPKPFNTVPATDGHRVYVGDGDSRLYAVNADAGGLAWSFASGGKGIMSSPALGPDNSVVFGSSDNKVYCLDAGSGALRWSFGTGGVVLAAPLITGGLVWVGSFDGKFYCLDLHSGALQWSAELEEGVFTSAAESEGRVVVAGRGGLVLCVAASGGL